MRRIAISVLAISACFGSGRADASDGVGGGASAIDTSSSDSGTTVVVVDNGTTVVGGGYAGADGVMTCSWYSVGDRPGSTHESYTETAVAHLVQGLTYYFQCFSLATGERLEANWRIYDPPAGNPIANLSFVASDYATEALDYQPLPPPALVTAPPVGAQSIVNISTWVWTTTPPTYTAETFIDANNHSTVTATPTTISIEPGDGSATRTCPPNPSPWQPGASDDDPNSCQITFRRPGTFTMTATLEWETTFESVVAGQRITGTVGARQTSATITVTVNEAVAHIQ